MYQLRARGATSRLFQRLVPTWDALAGAQAVLTADDAKGNQYFHASKGWAPLHPSTSLKGVLGDDGVQLAAAFRETRGDSLK